MAGFYGEEQVQKVLAASDIVGLVGAYTPVRKSGANFSCCCLFHQERTPSMYLYPADNSYYCFGCGAHGNAFRLVMERERLDFVEALEHLAQRAGITLVSTEGRGRPQIDRGLRERYVKANAFACEFYEGLLWSNAGAAALTYLRSRGLRDDVIRAFRLGWAPGGGALIDACRARRADVRLLLPLDLAVERDGRLRDRFYERITFPICDRQGQVLAFSARLLPEAERRAKEEGRGVGKYINSTETPLYSKGRTVFNLHQARTAVRESGHLVVMEGPTDVMAAWQAGHKSCVAVLGTAFTVEHAKSLAQVAAGARLILLFDGDQAGQTNTLKAVRTCVGAGISCLVATLPDQLDPSELLTEENPDGTGANRFTSILHGAREGFAHLLRGLVPKPYSMDREALAQAARTLAATVMSIPDPQSRALALKQAQDWLQFPITLQTNTPASAASPVKESAPLDNQRDLLLHVMLQEPARRGIFADQDGLEPSDWPAPWDELAGVMLFDPQAKSGDFHDISAMKDPHVAKRLAWWMAHPLTARTPPVDNIDAVLPTAIRRLIRDRLTRQRAELQHRINEAEQAGDFPTAAELGNALAAVAARLADLR